MEVKPVSGDSDGEANEPLRQDAALRVLEKGFLNAYSCIPVSHCCDMCETVLKELFHLAQKHLAKFQPVPTEQQQYICQSCGRGFYFCLEENGVKIIRSEPGQHPFRQSYSVKGPNNAFAMSENEMAFSTLTFVKTEDNDSQSHSSPEDIEDFYTIKSFNTFINHTCPYCTGGSGEADHRATLICSTCGKKSIPTRSLEAQQKISQAKVGFVCDVCGKVLRRKFSLSNHKKLHTGDRPYVCIECGKSYITRSHLHRHNKYHIAAVIPVNEVNEQSPLEATPASSTSSLQ